MDGKLSGQVAIVTGASRGIGHCIAARLVADGAKVCITGRRQEALDEAVLTLGGIGNAIAVQGRADDVEHQADAIVRTLKAFGRVDMLVNNAGINPVYGPMIELDLAAARKVFEVNALAALSWTQQVYKAWMADHGGSLVNISSVAGLKPAPGIGFYGASKAMLAHITEELAVELAPTIRINAVAPAVVKTDFAAALYDGKEAETASAYPMKRLGVPDDIADIVAFLLSDDAAWITGQVIVVDGGLALTGGI
ncbi:SDR family oxidoreductase [Mycobacterium colombiense]|uniref:SDR family oxidoreductase n=1 Tax=Mycobacterium colombiense TaxID=339268 RepID=UPI00200B1CB3|nr:SDR family oxidoreductase [Mycobacterium colombiense]MCK8642340.1 SDR family oxidoreductase [Mycobacterium colombiense]